MAAITAALLMAGPAVALATRDGHSHSAKACPTHKHSSGNHGTKGHKNGASKGKKCGATTHTAISGTSGGNPTTAPGDDQGDENDQGDSGDDQGDSSDDQGDSSDDQGDSSDDQGQDD